MKVIITARELHERTDWVAACDLVGLNPWCLNEGMSGDREFVLSEKDAAALGLLPPVECGCYSFHEDTDAGCPLNA